MEYFTKALMSDALCKVHDAQAKVKFLIVDDDPYTRMSLSHIFTELGYSVRRAEDGFSALFEIRQEIPDIILSDLNMPGMSGFEFLSVVRGLRLRRPRVIYWRCLRDDGAGYRFVLATDHHSHARFRCFDQFFYLSDNPFHI
jgi:CheY-like chemotaxis protein